MLYSRNLKVNKTCFVLTKSFSLMGKVDRKVNIAMSKRYSNRNVQKNKRECLILPGRSKENFSYEIILELIADRKDEESIPNIKNSIAKLAGENALIYVETSPLTESEAFKEFANSNNIVVVNNCEEAIKDIYNRNIHDIKVENDVNKGIIYIHKTIDDEERYMLVNTSENEANVEITFKHSTAPTVYDVKNDKIITPEIKTNENTTTINLNFKKYQAMFVIF